MEDLNTCKLCRKNYGEGVRPRGLPCGHSHCTKCLQNRIREGHLACPSCSEVHLFSDISEVSVNYDLEECLSKIAERNSKSNTRKKLIEDQKASAQDMQNSIQRMKRELSEYHQFLERSRKEHTESAQKFYALAARNETLVREIEEERSQVEEFLTKTHACSNNLQNNIYLLESAFRAQMDTGSALLSAMETSLNLGGWIDSYHEKFPNTYITSSRKALLKPLKYLTDVNFEGENTILSIPRGGDLSVLEKASFLMEKEITFPDLPSRLMEPLWKERISSGQVIAIDSNNGRQRCSKLSMRDGRIYLHCLQDKKDLTSLFRLKHSDVISCLSKEKNVAFLDIAWDGCSTERIHILLEPYTPLAHQFRLLCTGDKGPSYLKSKFFKAGNFGQPNEAIMGGDYEYNNGSGGKSIVKGIKRSDSKYSRTCDPGIVWSYSDDDDLGAQFVIVVGPGDNSEFNSVFGQVQDNLNVLKDAFRRTKKTKDVEIVDCGVELCL